MRKTFAVIAGDSPVTRLKKKVSQSVLFFALKRLQLGNVSQHAGV